MVEQISKKRVAKKKVASVVKITVNYIEKESILILPKLANDLLIGNVLPRIQGGQETTVEGKIKELLSKLIEDVIRSQIDLKG